MMLIAASSSAQAPKTFTTVKELPITSVKNQFRSGTCWDYGTLGYREVSSIIWNEGKPELNRFTTEEQNTTYIFLNRNALPKKLRKAVDN